MRVLQELRYVLRPKSATLHQLFPNIANPCGPFNSCIQIRFNKPICSAQTRLENRTIDSKLDKLMRKLRKLKMVIQLNQLMANRKRGPFVSVQTVSKWKNMVGVNVNMGSFLRKYPHVFEVFVHPVRRNVCCKIRECMKDLIREEESVVREMEIDAKIRVKKLLMMSKNGRVHVHALRLMKGELGLSEDFVNSLLRKFTDEFRMVDLEVVELVERDESLCVAEIEKWREREYTDKWLSQFETMYAFPIDFPTGFRIEKGFKEKLRNWQRLQYVKPYERKEVVRARTCGGVERFEKRAVGILHELLGLTVEKMVEIDRLAHFRKDFNMEVNIRELLLKHPGIFYVSTKGNTQMVFLREAYCQGCLIEPNPIYLVRRKMLDLLLLGCRHTKELENEKDVKKNTNDVKEEIITKHNEHLGGRRDGDWVLPILESSENQNFSVGRDEDYVSSDEEREQKNDKQVD